MLQETLGFYKNITIDKEIIEKVLGFNYYNVDTLSDLELSKYSIILAQYMVYFRWQLNETKVEHMKLKNKLEATLFHLLSHDVLKMYKTKADARSYLINNSPELATLSEQADALEYELILAEGLDKPVQEMINVFKREQSRRENELNATRFERR